MIRKVPSVISLYLTRKYARIFVRGHYLSREATELRGTDNIQVEISEHIYAPNGGYCVCYPSNLFRNERSFENWEYINNSHHLARKCARIFVRGHYLFREANESVTVSYEEQIMSSDKYPSIF